MIRASNYRILIDELGFRAPTGRTGLMLALRAAFPNVGVRTLMFAIDDLQRVTGMDRSDLDMAARITHAIRPLAGFAGTQFDDDKGLGACDIITVIRAAMADENDEAAESAAPQPDEYEYQDGHEAVADALAADGFPEPDYGHDGNDSTLLRQKTVAAPNPRDVIAEAERQRRHYEAMLVRRAIEVDRLKRERQHLQDMQEGLLRRMAEGPPTGDAPPRAR